jgi:hypothetical protein
MGSPGPAGKNIQDQIVAVEDTAIQFPFDISDLGRRETVVENDHIYRIFADPCLNFFEFTGSDIGTRVGMVEILNKPLYGNTPGRFHQKRQFVKVLVCNGDILVSGRDANQYSRFGNRGGGDH